MAYPTLQRELTAHLYNGNWNVRPIEDTRVLGPIDYGWHRYNLFPDSFTFGEGLLAGSSIPGTRRLFFCAWSPQWESFYVSSMGGAAYTFHGVGVNYVALRGRAHEPSVLLLNHRQGEIHVRLEPLNPEPVWTGYADPDGERLIGFYALQQALYDRYAALYPPNKARIFCVGPAALHTREGVIGSSPLRNGRFQPSDEWAGRGGLGSRLLQYHNIVGCVFGGEWEDPDLRDSKEIDAYFMEHFGQKTIQTDLAVTTKYRYAPEFETGGTFGVNMKTLNTRILSFNYLSIYADDDMRLRQHDLFVLQHYLKQFNTETIESKQQTHCGEPCAVACKKYNGRYKKDYEPYHALGPQIGVFDQRAAEVVNHYADAMGFDSIQLGGTLAWIMELIAEELIEPRDFGFPSSSELKFQFTADPQAFDLVTDSMRNARFAVELINAILFLPGAAIFREGMRVAAHTLDDRYESQLLDRAVYLANGDEGYMVPNQYWVPGMLSNMPLMGKYYCYYGVDFMPPEDLGRKHVERWVYELFSDNSGICRFHRKWSEAITDEILEAHYNLQVNYKQRQYDLAKAIYEREHAKAVPWESARIGDIIEGFLLQWRRDGLENEALNEWISCFEEDKPAAMRAFWEAIQHGIASAFEAGAAAIPEILTPGQAGALPAVEPRGGE